MCFTLHSHSMQRADQHIANNKNSCLPTMIHPVYLKKSQKTFYIKFNRKRCNNWHMIGFIHCRSEKFTDTGFLATSQLMLEEVASYIWAHSNSLIKKLIPFEDDAEISLLNFLIQSICKQPEDTFTKMTSPKIDFYFEVFEKL